MRLTILTLLAALTACAGNAHANSAASPAPPDRKLPLGACTSVAPPRLLSPKDGSIGVPDAGVALIVRYTANPQAAFGAAYLTSLVAPKVNAGPWKPAGPGQWSAQLGKLAPKARYSVNVSNAACGQRYSIGYFATK